jgi:multicomponent Na+:H+ antiporter subunit D
MMTNFTLIWMATPFFWGLLIYLLPKFDRYFTFFPAVVSLIYASALFLLPEPLELQLSDNFGVSLIADELSGFFVLTNAIVTIAVILYCWQTDKKPFFYTQIAIVHGSVNAAFICADFMSLYVALEVIGIASFLLVSYPRTNRSLWVGLRYLFLSNIAMLFYLVGAILVYQANNSFAFTGLGNGSPEAIALIFVGLLTKAGVFVSGLWLPLTHSESETPVSALLSGIVVKAGIYPLLRCALLVDEVGYIIRIFGVLTALLGVFYAIFEQDTKRLLASSTVSQLGFMLAAPSVGGFYALTHGLVKSSLFLIAGVLPSRSFAQLQQTPINTKLWLALVTAAFSISGFPLLSGFGAKVLTSKNYLPWQVIAMNVAATGTAIAMAKFIFLPRGGATKLRAGFWPGVLLLLIALFAANIFYYQAYTLDNIVKPLLIIAIGWLIYWFVIRKVAIKLPRTMEEFDHQTGIMSLILIMIFWLVMVRY